MSNDHGSEKRDDLPDDGPTTVQRHGEVSGKRLLSLSLLALGIVYGDIGTSPLYAVRECFHGAHAVPLTQANVYGVLSLIFWTLVIVVTLKYHVYVIRFDNRGEGGILALLGLIGLTKLQHKAAKTTLIAMGVFGAALLYGDGMITPAISVLSAVEGLGILSICSRRSGCCIRSSRWRPWPRSSPRRR
jgi:KUP system potassium uptake protein